MTRLLGIASFIVVAAAIAGCTGAGGYGAGGNGGGAYGGGGALPSAAEPTVAAVPSVAPAAASASAQGGRYDYGTPAPAGSGASGSGAGAASAPAGTVLLSGIAFQPSAVTIAAGTDLAFSNQDSVRHVLVEGEGGTPAPPSAAKSPVGPGQTVTLPFPKAGTVKITCTIHPSMNLTVTVSP